MTSEEATSRAKVFFYYMRCLESTDLLSLQCAQRRTSREILEAYNQIDDFFREKEGAKTLFSGFTPAIDEIVFSQSISELAAKSAFKNCTVMTGYNSEEFSLFALYYYNILQKNSSNFLTEAEKFNSNQFSMALEDVFKYYPIYPKKDMFMLGKIFHEYLSPSELHSLWTLSPAQLLKELNQIATDYHFACQSYQLASLYSKAGNKAYVYNFDYQLSNSAIPVAVKDFLGKATHGDELTTTFAVALLPESFQMFSQAERDFTQKIVFYWTNFVRFDDPSSISFDSVTTWLPFLNSSAVNETAVHATGRFLLMSNDNLSMKSGFTSHHCKFWGY